MLPAGTPSSYYSVVHLFHLHQVISLTHIYVCTADTDKAEKDCNVDTRMCTKYNVCY